TAQVAGAIQPVMGVSGEPAGKKLALGKLRVSQIAESKMRAAHVNLPRLADPRQLPAAVDYQELNVLNTVPKGQNRFGPVISGFGAGSVGSWWYFEET